MTKEKPKKKTTKKGKSEAGRPTIMTPQMIATLEEAYLANCTDEEACLYAGIGTSTLYNYQEKNPKFVERKRMLKANVKMHAKINLRNSVEIDQNIQDSKYVLDRTDKDHNPKIEQDITSDGMPLQIHILDAEKDV